MRSFCCRGVQAVFFLLIFCAVPLALEAAVDPVVVEVHYQSGVKFYKRGLYDKAAREFKKTLALDPSNAEAREYLEETQRLLEKDATFDAGRSRNEEIRSLYEEGRRLYGQRDYRAAIEVFDKILTLKPIDDFASYYKERSEMLLGRQLAKEKKLEDRRRQKEARAREAAALKEKKREARAMRAAGKAVPPKGREGTVEKTLNREEGKRVYPQTLALEKEDRLTEKERRRQEKIVQKEEKRRRKLEEKAERLKKRQERMEAKRAAAEERRAQKIEARQEKIDRKRQTRESASQGKAAEREMKRQEKKDRKAVRQEAIQERRDNKALFLQGVQEYGRKQYSLAVDTFQAVIDAEKKSGKVYTNSAKRLMLKAQDRLKGIGQDVKIGTK